MNDIKNGVILGVVGAIATLVVQRYTGGKI